MRLVPVCAPDGPGEWSFGTYTPDGRSMIESHGENDRDDRCYVRAKAWAWHDRRHALAECEGNVLHWSVYLAMTDAEVVFAEANPPVIVTRGLEATQ